MERTTTRESGITGSKREPAAPGEIITDPEGNRYQVQADHTLELLNNETEGQKIPHNAIHEGNLGGSETNINDEAEPSAQCAGHLGEIATSQTTELVITPTKKEKTAYDG